MVKIWSSDSHIKWLLWLVMVTIPFGRTQRMPQRITMTCEISNIKTHISSSTQSMHQIIALTPITSKLCYILHSYTRTQRMNQLISMDSNRVALTFNLEATCKNTKFIKHAAKINPSSVHVMYNCDYSSQSSP